MDEHASMHFFYHNRGEGWEGKGGNLGETVCMKNLRPLILNFKNAGTRNNRKSFNEQKIIVWLLILIDKYLNIRLQYYKTNEALSLI